MKTLLFCTGYAPNLKKWDKLYGRWVKAIEASSIHYDKILIPDDGSPELPTWTATEIMNEGLLPDHEPQSPRIIYRHQKNLGRQGLFVYPGWHRSFMVAAAYAKKYGYEKIIHIESDAFILSANMQSWLNNFDQGWTVFWCPKHELPETAIQVIAGTASLNDLYKLIDIPYSEFSGRPADPKEHQGESWLPYDTVNKNFKGNRWGEKNRPAPRKADFICQVSPDSSCWWLNEPKSFSVKQTMKQIISDMRFWLAI